MTILRSKLRAAVAAAAIVAPSLVTSVAHANTNWPGFFYGTQSPPWTPFIHYQGGRVMNGVVDVYVLYYGSYWTQSAASLDISVIDDFVQNMGSSGYGKILTTYYDKYNRHPKSTNLVNTWFVSGGYGSSLYDGAGNSMQNLVHDQVKAHLSEIARKDSSVIVLVPSPDVLTYTGGNAGGWHTELAKTAMGDLPGFAYPVPIAVAGASAYGGTAWYPGVLNSPYADNVANLIAHELAEAITNPNPNTLPGWSGAEIGDNCEPGGQALKSGEDAWGPNVGPGMATAHIGARDYHVQRLLVNRGRGYCAFNVRTQGDFNADGKADLVNIDGWPGGGSDPVEYLALSTPGVPFAGTFDATKWIPNNFNYWSSQQSMHNFTGDFSGTGMTGFAALPGAWSDTSTMVDTGYFDTIGGTFNKSWSIVQWNTPVGDAFPSNSGKIVAGDFYGAGYTGFAALNGNLIPILTSAYWTTNPGQAYTNAASTWDNATMSSLYYAPHVFSGDFNGDGYDDITATGVSWWQTVPVAFSNGDGTFKFINLNSPFAAYAATAGAKVLAGDFNGDGLTDLLAVGPWGSTVHVAVSDGFGHFPVEDWSSDFYLYSTQPNVHVIVGDFDGDGRDDLSAVGGSGWNTIPVALSRSWAGFGYFSATLNVHNTAQAPFATRAANGTSQTLSSWYSEAFL